MTDEDSGWSSDKYCFVSMFYSDGSCGGELGGGGGDKDAPFHLVKISSFLCRFLGKKLVK